MTYRGTQGDVVFLAAAGAKFPSSVPIPPCKDGLELNPGALLLLVGPLPVTAANGELSLDFPGLPIARPIYEQFLALPVGSSGYEPGCFTNTIAL